MRPDEALDAFDAWLLRTRPRRRRYDLLDLTSPDGIVLGEAGRFLRDDPDGGYPHWGFTRQQVQRMRDAMADAARATYEAAQAAAYEAGDL